MAGTSNMAFIKISKPTTRSWANTNPSGRTQYDQSDITYDDANTFWDGIDPNFWNKVTKPTNNFLIVPGMATGIIGPPTYSKQYDASNWIKVSKPN